MTREDRPYVPRVVDAEIRRKLASMGVVVLEGAKACGKTASGLEIAGSEVFLDVDADARRTIQLDPALVLQGTTPRLIDEWQVEPRIWNHIRREVDARGQSGQFLLTGSAVPADDITRHTGAGRVARVRMRPLSLFESGDSSGAVSLRHLLAREDQGGAQAEIDLGRISVLLARGGWPGHLTRNDSAALDANRAYLDEIRRTDIRRIDGVDRDPERVRRFLMSFARHVSTSAAMSAIAADVGGGDGPIQLQTALEYAKSLTRLMVLEDQPAWAPHLRSRSRLRTSDKRHFTDPSLAVAALRATPDRLLHDLEFLGLLFESLAIRDLRVYAQAAEGVVFHYRDNTGLEIDAVVEAPEGWGGFEIKLGGDDAIETAATSLLRFLDRIDTQKMGEPAVLAVITAVGRYAYQREDGVWVIPIGALGP
jgi:predicted AAA+ superfamily ATPase